MKATVLLFLSAVVACAQQASPAPATANANISTPAPLKLGRVTVTGSIRSRLESWDWFEPSSADPNYTYSGTLVRLNFSQAFERWDWQAELAIPILLGLPDSAVAPGTQGALGLGANYFTANDRNRNAAMLFPKIGFVRIKQLFGDSRQSIRLGRFEYADGSETVPKNGTLAALKRDRINMRLVGNFGWSHVGRSFDGAHYAFNTARSNFTLLGAIPTRGVFQTDGWGETSTSLAYSAYTRTWGKGRHEADTRIFAIGYFDWRSVLKTDNRALATRRNDIADIRLFTFGGHSVHAIQTRAGTADLLFWGAGQTGDWGLQQQRAYAVAFEGGLQPRVLRKLKPWVRAGYFRGSGDSDPNDAKHGTFFQLLPTPRPFARFPFFNLMNNRDINGALILRPHPKVTTSTEFHALALTSGGDLWYTGGGVYQPWSFGYVGLATNGARSLANLYDTSLEFRQNRSLIWTGYFGHAQGLAVMKQIYPAGKDGNFGYVELMYRF